jgi:hypothetical protein
MTENSGRRAGQTWQRAHMVDMLRRNGYPELADEALHTLPEVVGLDQLTSFCREHDISRDELISSMGGSP